VLVSLTTSYWCTCKLAKGTSLRCRLHLRHHYRHASTRRNRRVCFACSQSFSSLHCNQPGSPPRLEQQLGFLMNRQMLGQSPSLLKMNIKIGFCILLWNTRKTGAHCFQVCIFGGHVVPMRNADNKQQNMEGVIFIVIVESVWGLKTCTTYIRTFRIHSLPRFNRIRFNSFISVVGIGKKCPGVAVAKGNLQRLIDTLGTHEKITKVTGPYVDSTQPWYRQLSNIYRWSVLAVFDKCPWFEEKHFYIPNRSSLLQFKCNVTDPIQMANSCNSMIFIQTSYLFLAVPWDCRIWPLSMAGQ
jgi:hypothetical protein